MTSPSASNVIMTASHSEESIQEALLRTIYKSDNG